MPTIYKQIGKKRFVVQQHGWTSRLLAQNEAVYFREHGLRARVIPIKDVPQLRKKHGSKGFVVLSRRPTKKELRKLSKRRRRK